MTEIRIRQEHSGESATLGDVDFLSLDDVIPMLKRWGIYDTEDGDIDLGTLAVQFVVDTATGEAYFEVTYGSAS